MGLFDAIRRRISGNGEGGDRQNGDRTDPHDEHRPSDPPTDPQSSASVGGGGPHAQSHGSHWDTLVPDENRERAIQDVIMTTVSEGEVVASQAGGEIAGHLLRDGPVGTVSVSLGGQILTSYPVVEGVSHDVEVEALNEWESGVEAWVGGTLASAALSVFASNYFEHPAAYFGGDSTVSLALLAYDFGASEYDTVVDENGEEVDVSDFVGFRPWERGAPDDHVVRTKVKESEPVSCVGYDGHYLRVPLFRTEDGAEIDVALFVADHVAGDYVPRVGDTVEGACWLQAWFR